MANLSREHIFNGLKDLVLTLIRNPELEKNSELFKNWSAKSRDILDGQVLLSEHDRMWLTKVYEEWYKSNSEVQKSISEFKKKYPNIQNNLLTPKK